MGYLRKEWEYYGERKGKHNFSTRQRGLSFELSIKDETGVKIDFLRWNDQKGYESVSRILKTKYGLKPVEVKKVMINIEASTPPT